MNSILPKNVFDKKSIPINKNSKLTKITSTKKTTIKKKINESDEDSFIDIDKSNESNESNESDKSNKSDESKNTTFKFIDKSVPVYDGVEEYYLFVRRWDAYTRRITDKQLYDNILNFINQLFSTEFKCLLEIKKLDEKLFPHPQKIVDIIQLNENFKRLFRIKYNQNIPTPKMLNSLLNKVKLSLIRIEGEKKTYYYIKSGIQKNITA